jgi:L-ascorbate metabolism protein UlaG (beta-lactamase superfamily)
MIKIKWHGHAAFEITSATGKKIYIDPWIEQNPSCQVTLDQLSAPDLVLVTHDHFDHMANAADLLKKGGMSVGQPELIAQLVNSGIDQERLIGMNIGGTVEVAGIKVTMTQAFHSAGQGSPTGFILTMEDGTVLYHSGDTGIFGAMKILGDIYNIDLAMIPIGSVFTMDPVQAAEATRMLSPKKVIPMHYRSFPILVQNAAEFSALVKQKAPDVEVVVMDPGQEIEY